MVFFVRSFRFDCSVNAVKLGQIDVTVNIFFLLAVFVRYPPLLTLVIPPITNST